MGGVEHDELTGMLNRVGFSAEIDKMLTALSDEERKEYLMVYLDIQRFKAVNELFGVLEGDRFLIHVAQVINEIVHNKGLGCRVGSDRYLAFFQYTPGTPDEALDNLLQKISSYNLPFEIMCNAGVYLPTDENIAVERMIDRAIMAQGSIKGSYTTRYTYYDDRLRADMLSENEIVGNIRIALKERQFVAYFQPQYNHSTGMLVGAEALVRWIHPEHGLISPGRFIPVFEKNGFITQLDLYVFEMVCQFQRRCLDEGLPCVPISTNLTRYDIFRPDFIDKLEIVRNCYEIPANLLRLEITESVAFGNSQYINEAVRKLHNLGYIVEMDDFGSGYSSLNILKDIDFDVIKLDMRFLQDTQSTNQRRGGTILSSVVRMLNWLKLPIIAEGVEEQKQADFLGSIGCDYIQGFVYSKPLPEEEYVELLKTSRRGLILPKMRLRDKLEKINFWDDDSLETTIFSEFVGPACIFDYQDDRVDILRVNTKYVHELGMNMAKDNLIHTNPLDILEGSDRILFKNMLKRAIETEEEQESETWCKVVSNCCGEETICIRTRVQLLGEIKGNYLFFSTIQNVTDDRRSMREILASERRFNAVTEHANIYYWEYNISTHEMRPCFRCRRDLGFPAILDNYPESAFEMGVFPPETHEMYRGWMKQLEEGVQSLEAVIPLTEGRIPFHVRYTTEFDEFGRPIKAYGSATKVVDRV